MNINREICVITANQLENENPARNRILSLINGFLNKGYQVKLISMDSEAYSIVKHDNFEHYKIPFINTKIPSFLKRAFYEILIAKNAIYKANELNCDLNLITIPSMFLLHLSFLLKNGNKKILDVRDLSWEYLSDKSAIQRVAKQVFRISAYRNLKKFDFIDVTNDHELNYIKAAAPNTPVFKMTNGVSRSIYNQLSALPEKNIEAEKVVVTYIGNIGLAQDLSTLIEASKKLTDFHFNIVGNGTDFERISKHADKNQSNIKFWGQVNFDTLKTVYSETDILYAQLAPEFSGAMPSKLYEYLATGKYVVYGGGDVAVNILKDFENISIIEPQNIQKLIEILENLKTGELYNSNSLANKNRIAEEFVREKSVEKFIDFIASRPN
ncbi:glycosyltransferase [Acinetobacter sp.]|uniref:glycosyltransferase n=1 Tax=Acinetobacter sp. TaxID=472 RepID=UPI0035AE4237